jgi:hypothetical protein
MPLEGSSSLPATAAASSPLPCGSAGAAFHPPAWTLPASPPRHQPAPALQPSLPFLCGPSLLPQGAQTPWPHCLNPQHPQSPTFAEAGDRPVPPAQTREGRRALWEAIHLPRISPQHVGLFLLGPKVCHLAGGAHEPRDARPRQLGGILLAAWGGARRRAIPPAWHSPCCPRVYGLGDRASAASERREVQSRVLPVVVVAAAGRARRFSGEQKVLAAVGGRPAVCRVADVCEEALGPHRQVVVIGHRGAHVRAVLGEVRGREYVTQEQQLGTGHALAVALAHLEDRPDVRRQRCGRRCGPDWAAG